MTGSSSGVERLPLPQDDPVRRRSDTTRAREILGWEASVPLEVGLPSTIEYFRSVLWGIDAGLIVRPAANDWVLAGAVDGADVEAESWCKMPVRKAFARRSHSGSRSLDSKEGSWHTQRESE